MCSQIGQGGRIDSDEYVNVEPSSIICFENEVWGVAYSAWRTGATNGDESTVTKD